MTFVVVTGPIGSGKSSLSAALAKLGAQVFNADGEVHRLYREDKALQKEISQLVGTNLVSEDGSLDRRRLGELVFADESLRRSLETLVHPKVQETFRNYLQDHRSNVVVYDVSFFRSGVVPDPDLVIWVEAPSEVRIERLLQRGLTRKDALRRIEIQDEVLVRPEGSVEVFVNDGSQEAIQAFANRIWNRLKRAQ